MADIGQRFLINQAEHQGIANTLYVNVLRSVDKTQLFGNADCHRVATFEYFGTHDVATYAFR
jgi:hypothetical protein